MHPLAYLVAQGSERLWYWWRLDFLLLFFGVTLLSYVAVKAIAQAERPARALTAWQVGLPIGLSFYVFQTISYSDAFLESPPEMVILEIPERFLPVVYRLE